MSELYDLTIEEVSAGLAAGTFTSLEVTEACLEHIAKHEKKLNSFVRVEADIARRQAKESDERRAKGEARGILDGIPYTLKDVYATQGSPTTASSHVLKDWVAPYDATVYRKLCEAGAVMLGKTNTDEFTMGSSTETSYYGVTRNPWDIERVAGGSSGGPASAMAARFGIFAIGTDTGGSIRQPAAFCGIVGLKPTYGRVSRFGELPMASSLDQTGPITKTVRDAAIVLEVLAGQDPLDATTSAEPVEDFLNTCDEPLTGKKVGVPKEFFGEGVKPEVEQLVREAIAELARQGAEIVEVSLPTALSSLAAYYIVASAEISSNMMRYDGIRFGYSVEREESGDKHSLYDVYAKSRAAGIGSEVKRRIMLGTHVLSSGYYDAYYNKGEAVRVAVADEFAEVFKTVDVIVAPVSPHTAFKVGAISDPLTMYKEDVLTVPVNIAGLPGMSVPCGLVDGLPVGLQIIGARFNEASVLTFGAAYQSATSHHLNKPTLS
jgi:aspartyl-tRNA(Asn)/glutamyl-tRNA(Gln) amidotransferase subunit A